MRITTRPEEGGDLFAAVGRTPARWATSAIVLVLAFMFELDRRTGSAPAQHLYYLPIIFTAIRFGAVGGVAAAILATALYHVANPRLLTFAYVESDWVQITLFAAVALVTARMAFDARRLRRLAMSDDLTGLHNLRSFEIGLSGMLRGAAGRSPIVLLVLDVDRLKGINDRHGHLAGADAVKTVGRLIADWAPAGALACRYGGDEFVVAVANLDRAGAIALADRLRTAVADTVPLLAGESFPQGTLSVSIGVVCRDGAAGRVRTTAEAAREGERLFRAADAELYRAKETGRNRTSAA